MPAAQRAISLLRVGPSRLVTALQAPATLPMAPFYHLRPGAENGHLGQPDDTAGSPPPRFPSSWQRGRRSWHRSPWCRSWSRSTWWCRGPRAGQAARPAGATCKHDVNVRGQHHGQPSPADRLLGPAPAWALCNPAGERGGRGGCWAGLATEALNNGSGTVAGCQGWHGERTQKEEAGRVGTKPSRSAMVWHLPAECCCSRRPRGCRSGAEHGRWAPAAVCAWAASDGLSRRGWPWGRLWPLRAAAAILRAVRWTKRCW
jgi:hypothetical protein